jgi:hypothetical protein
MLSFQVASDEAGGSTNDSCGTSVAGSGDMSATAFLSQSSCASVTVSLCGRVLSAGHLVTTGTLDGDTKGVLTPLEHGLSTTLAGTFAARPYDEEHCTPFAARALHACKRSHTLDFYYCQCFPGSTPGTLLASIVDRTYRSARLGEEGQLDKSFLGWQEHVMLCAAHGQSSLYAARCRDA